MDNWLLVTVNQKIFSTVICISDLYVKLLINLNNYYDSFLIMSNNKTTPPLSNIRMITMINTSDKHDQKIS